MSRIHPFLIIAPVLLIHLISTVAISLERHRHEIIIECPRRIPRHLHELLLEVAHIIGRRLYISDLCQTQLRTYILTRSISIGARDLELRVRESATAVGI